MSLSNYAELKLLDHLLGTAAFTLPTAYLALYTSDPGEANSGSELAVANGYARQVCAFAAASGGQAANSAQKTFTAVGGNWGTITHFAIFDAGSAGNMLAYGALSASRIINNGDSLVFPIGSIVVSGD